MTDALLARLTYTPPPAATELLQIPWPAGLNPKPQRINRDKTAPFPAADAVITMWTTAEAMAFADVLTPGLQHTAWTPYAKDWSSYLPQLTPRSPAKEEGCVAHYALTTVGSLRVLVVKSELHLSTDGESVPVCDLWKAIAEEATPRIIVDGGTAGGIGEDVAVGDVLLTNTARFDCTGAFKDKPWANASYTTTFDPASVNVSSWDALTGANARLLAPQTTRQPILRTGQDVLTCDSFLFSDAEDTYHLSTYDPNAGMEEMDFCTAPLALGTSIPIASARVASDPEMPRMSTVAAEKKAAEQIYDRFGYASTVCSAIACWLVVASL